MTTKWTETWERMSKLALGVGVILAFLFLAVGCAGDLRNIGGSGADNRKPPLNAADKKIAGQYTREIE